MRKGALEYVSEVFDAEGSAGVFEQCLLARTADGGEERGWTWAWNRSEPRGAAFLGVVFGWKPPAPNTTDSRLPVAIEDVRALTVRYQVASESAGQGALVLALSFVSSSGAGAPSERVIVSRAVVWLDYPASAEPPGTKRGIAGVSGARYEVWHARGDRERSGRSAPEVFTFRGPNRHPAGTVQLEPFVAHLVGERLVAPELFVASVELGNEIAGGSGTTWVEHFDVTLASSAAH